MLEHMVSAAYFPDWEHALRKLIAVLELAAIALASGLFPLLRCSPPSSSSGAGPRGKTIFVPPSSASRLGPSAAAGRLKFKARPKITGIGFANDIADFLAEDFCLKEKSGGIGPIEDGDGDTAAAVREIVVLDFRERAGAGDAGNARVLEDVSLAGIERRRADGGFPVIVRRTGRW